MARPTTLPTWATDANYGTGPFAGQPTKLEPAAGIQLQGFYPEMPGSSRHQNWWQNLVHLWISHFSTEYPLVEVFESNGTWTKPAWAKWVYAVAVGRGGAAGANVPGGGFGGGGGSGFIATGAFLASMVQSTMDVVVARHDTSDTESQFGIPDPVNPLVDNRLLRARSGFAGGDASGDDGGHGGDGWAGGGGGRADTGGTGGTGGRGYGGNDGGIFAPIPLGAGTGPGGSGMNGGNGNTSGAGSGGGRTRPGQSAIATISGGRGGDSPLVSKQLFLPSGAQRYGQGQDASSLVLPGNGVVIVVSY